MVIFNSLDKDHIFKIIDIALKDLMDRMENMGFKFKLSKGAKNLVAEKGFDPQYGARPLHRAIQKYLEDPLAEFILGESPEEGSVLEAQLNKTRDGIKIALKKTAKSDIKE